MHYRNIKKSIILGMLFGDEGKGVTTQWLCQQSTAAGELPIVVRFSGGPQAGHTVIHDGVQHICSTYGSGTLLGVPTFVSSNAYFDPICAYNEYKVLCNKMGKENVPKLIIGGGCSIITPFDVLAGQHDSKVVKDGTCGKGLYATFKRYEDSYICYYPKDARDHSAAELRRLGKMTWATADTYYSENHKNYDSLLKEADRYYDLYTEAWTALHDVITLAQEYSDDELEDSLGYNHIIYEGSQGLLLDMERGLYPNVTPSKVGLNGLGPDDLKNAEVYFVVRSYLTRHGNGYEPDGGSELRNLLKDKPETNVNNEWQGVFKVGYHDQRLLDKAFERHCIDNYRAMYNQKHNLVVTHADILPRSMWGKPKYRFDKIWTCKSAEGKFEEL